MTDTLFADRIAEELRQRNLDMAYAEGIVKAYYAAFVSNERSVAGNRRREEDCHQFIAINCSLAAEALLSREFSAHVIGSGSADASWKFEKRFGDALSWVKPLKL